MSILSNTRPRHTKYSSGRSRIQTAYRPWLEQLESRVALSNLYVSTHGSDANPGASADAPLRHIATAVGRLSPGMTLFIEGGTYYEQVITKMAGTVDRPITITSYNGTAVIDGSTQNWVAGSNQNQGMVELRAPYYKVQNLEIVNSKNTGIVLGADGLTVEGCEVAETQRHAISTDTRFQTGSGGTGVMIHSITLKGNTVYHAALKGPGYGQAISLIADGFLVSGNTVRDNTTEGIDIWLGSKHGEVADNAVYNNRRCGIFVDGDSYVRIDRNKVYNNTRDGIGISSEDPRYSTHDIWVYNNVVYDNQLTGIDIWDDPNNPGFHGSQNVLIANNTLVNKRTNIYLAGDRNTADIMNNLCYINDPLGKNLYSVATNSTFSIHNEVLLSNLNGFVSATAKDFRLTSSSPAIDKGSALPILVDDLGNTYAITTDFLGLSRTVNGHLDAGAYEYQ
jgi:parallel beta-helix repeat protein